MTAADSNLIINDEINLTLSTLNGTNSSSTIHFFEKSALTIASDDDMTFTGRLFSRNALLGEGTIVKLGAGTLTLGNIYSFSGLYEARDGKLLFDMVDQTASNGVIYATGTGIIEIRGRDGVGAGGVNSNVRMVFTGASGDIRITAGGISMLDNSNKTGGIKTDFGNATVTLDGGALIANSDGSYYMATTDASLVIGENNGYLRVYGSGAFDVTGTIVSGAANAEGVFGAIEHTDGGVLTLSGDFTGFRGDINNRANTINLSGVGNANMLNISDNTTANLIQKSGAATPDVMLNGIVGGAGSKLNILNGKLTLGAAGIVSTGTVTMGSATISASDNWSMDANVQLTSGSTTTFDLRGDWMVTLNGLLSQADLYSPSGLVKDGTGTLVLTNLGSTYSGGVTLRGGTLEVAGAGAMGATGGRNLTVGASQVGATQSIFKVTGANALNIDSLTTLTGAAFNLGGTSSLLALTVDKAVTFANATTLYLDINAAGTNDRINANSVTQQGALTLNLNTDARPANGTVYTVLSAAMGGTIDINNISIISPDRGDYRREIYQKAWTTGNLTLTVLSGASELTYTGTGGKIWDLRNTAAWTSSAAHDSTLFFSEDSVIFTTLSGVANETVSLVGALLPTAVTVSGTTNYTFTSGNNGADGTIAGAATLSKTGSSTLTVNTMNTYTGATTISGGRLIVGTNGALGTSAVSITSGGVLELNKSITNTITNAGVLDINLAGTATLNLTTTTGRINVVQGVLASSNATAYGSSASVSVGANGTLDLHGVDRRTALLDVSIAGTGYNGQGAIINTTAALAGIASGVNALTLTGDATIAAQTGFDWQVGGQTGSVVRLGGHTLTKIGTGKVTLAADQTGGGHLSVASGALAVSNGYSYDAVTADVLANAKLILMGGATAAEVSSKIGVVTGVGTVSFGGSFTLSDTQLLGLTGTLGTEENGRLQVNYGVGQVQTDLLDGNIKFALGNNSSIAIKNDTGSDFTFSVGDISSKDGFGEVILLGDHIRFEMNGTDWMDSIVNFYIGEDLNSKIYVDTALAGEIFTDITIENLTNGSNPVEVANDGQLIVITNFTELPRGGYNDRANIYQVTGPNNTNGLFTMTMNTYVKALKIVSSNTNTGFFMQAGNNLYLNGGGIIFEGTRDYTISGSTIYSDNRAKTVTINQNSTDATLTISSNIGQLAGISDTRFVKSGLGKLVLTGSLENKGGMLVSRGTLVLQGRAYGGGALVNAANMVVGDGVSAFSTQFTTIDNQDGASLTIRDRASLGSAAVTNIGTINILGSGQLGSGTLVNNGTLNFDLGTTGVYNLGAKGIGTGTTQVQTGRVAVAQGNASQNYAAYGTGTLQIDFSSADNIQSATNILGDGTILLNNTVAAGLDLVGTVAADWSGFTGTLSLQSAAGAFNVDMDQVLSDGVKVMIGNNTVLRDVAGIGATRNYDITLSTNGNGLVLNGIYEGKINLTNATSGISAGSASTVNSVISGGLLNVYGGSITLTAANTHAGTVVRGGTLTAAGATSLGSIARVTIGGTLNLATDVAVDSINMTGGALNFENNGLGNDGSLTIRGTDDSVLGTLTGGGNPEFNKIVKNGLASLTFNGGNSNFYGSIYINQGTARVGGTGAFGALGTTVYMAKGTTLDLGNVALGADASVSLAGGSSILRGGVYGGSLSVVGGNDTTVASADGNLSLNTLHMTNGNARLSVTGTLDIVNGGSFYLDASNVGNRPIVNVGGGATLNGSYTLDFDVNSVMVNNKATYTLFSTGVQNGLGGTGTCELSVPDTVAQFFTLDASQFHTTGRVTISRAAMVAALINQGDYPDPQGYTPGDSSWYLGAAAGNGLGAPVYFENNYTIPASDNAYRLTDGEGWLNMATAMMGATRKLVIAEYFGDSTITDKGVILSNNQNSYGAGTDVLNVHVIVDGNSHARGIEEGVCDILGTGTVTLIGQKAVLDLRTGGLGDDRSFIFNNDFSLRDGASIVQTESQQTLNGVVNVVNRGVIQNSNGWDLTLGGRIIGSELTLKGANDVNSTNVIRLDGADAQSTLLKLIINDKAEVKMSSGADLYAQRLTIASGSSLSLESGAMIGASALEGEGYIELNGGGIKAYGNLRFNLAGYMELRIDDGILGGSSLGSVIDTNGYTITMGALEATDKSFGLTGNGTLILSESMLDYSGTITAHNGVLKLNPGIRFGGDLATATKGKITTAAGAEIAGDVTLNNDEAISSEFANNTVIGGDLTVEGSSKLSSGKGVSIAGKLLVKDDGIAKMGQTAVTGDVVIEDKGSLLMGLGSKLEGNLEINSGSFSGIAQVMGADKQIYFGTAGSYVFDASTASDFLYNEVSGIYVVNHTGSGSADVSTGALDARGNVYLTESKNFGFNASMTDDFASGTYRLVSSGGIYIEDSLGGVSALDLIGGKPVDLRNFTTSTGTTLDMLDLGPNGDKFAWLSFGLLGTSSTGSLQVDCVDLVVTRNVDYARLTTDAEETSMANVLTYVAQIATDPTKPVYGEIKTFGTALANVLKDEASDVLATITKSNSSVLSGYVAQISNFQGHVLDIRNRASEEKPGIARTTLEDNGVAVIWANGVGGINKLDGTVTCPGYSSNMWGGTIGFSKSLSEESILGFAFTYTSTDVTVNDGFGTAKSDAYYVDAFLRNKQENWNFTTIISGGPTSMSTTRFTNFGGLGAARGTADGTQVMGLFEAGYELPVSNDGMSIFEPFGLVSVGYSSIGGFREEGNGNAGLNIDSQSNTLTTIGAGVRFVQEFFTVPDEALKGRFEARVMALQDIGDSEVKVEGNYIGAAGQKFNVEAANPGSTAINAGVGLVLPANENTSFFIDASTEFRSKYSSYNVNVGVKYSF